ncbi:hypothetical protein OHA98_31290 [Streptomyces sp. NBC_00654]|nr:hypothetical protein [Streptomyces sp. NBC_00654]MCX4969162.1 hypothetical protein [Streptomyces sp. NBC_00654]
MSLVGVRGRLGPEDRVEAGLDEMEGHQATPYQSSGPKHVTREAA